MLLFLLFPGHMFYKWLKGKPFSNSLFFLNLVAFLGMNAKWLGRGWELLATLNWVRFLSDSQERKIQSMVCFQYLKMPVSFQVSA